VGCGIVSTGKKRLSSGKYFLHFQERTTEEQWIFILKN
jgi:hypothetical protein